MSDFLCYERLREDTANTKILTNIRADDLWNMRKQIANINKFEKAVF